MPDLDGIHFELERLRVFESALEHALYHTLAGVIEAELKLDPCPAIKLAGEVAAHAIKRAKEEIPPEMVEFQRDDRKQIAEWLEQYAAQPKYQDDRGDVAHFAAHAAEYILNGWYQESSTGELTS